MYRFVNQSSSVTLGPCVICITCILILCSSVMSLILKINAGKLNG